MKSLDVEFIDVKATEASLFLRDGKQVRPAELRAENVSTEHFQKYAKVMRSPYFKRILCQWRQRKLVFVRDFRFVAFKLYTLIFVYVSAKTCVRDVYSQEPA